MNLYPAKPLSAEAMMRRAKAAISRAIDILQRLDGDDATASAECVKLLRQAHIQASRFHDIRSQIR